RYLSLGRVLAAPNARRSDRTAAPSHARNDDHRNRCQRRRGEFRNRVEQVTPGIRDVLVDRRASPAVRDARVEVVRDDRETRSLIPGREEGPPYIGVPDLELIELVRCEAARSRVPQIACQALGVPSHAVALPALQNRVAVAEDIEQLVVDLW